MAEYLISVAMMFMTKIDANIVFNQLAITMHDQCPMSPVEVLFKVHALEEKETWKP